VDILDCLRAWLREYGQKMNVSKIKSYNWVKRSAGFVRQPDTPNEGSSKARTEACEAFKGRELSTESGIAGIMGDGWMFLNG